MQNNWTVVVTPPSNNDDSIVTQDYIYKVSAELGYPIFPIEFFRNADKDATTNTAEEMLEALLRVGLSQKVYLDHLGSIFYFPNNAVHSRYDIHNLYIQVWSTDWKTEYTEYFDTAVLCLDEATDTIVCYIRRNEWYPEPGPKALPLSASDINLDGQLVNVQLYYEGGR